MRVVGCSGDCGTGNLIPRRAVWRPRDAPDYADWRARSARASWMRPLRGQHVGQAGAEVQRAAVEVLDPPAGLGDHQAAGPDVPGVGGVALQEAVDAARRDVGQAQRRRAQAPRPPALRHEGDHAAAERGEGLRFVGLHARAHQRAVEPLGGGHAEAFVAEPGAAAARGREQLAPERLEDGSGGQALRRRGRRPRYRRRGCRGRSWRSRRGDRSARSGRRRPRPVAAPRARSPRRGWHGPGSGAWMSSMMSRWAVTSAQVTIDERSVFSSTCFGRLSPSTRTAPPARAAATATSSSSAGDGLARLGGLGLRPLIRPARRAPGARRPPGW